MIRQASVLPELTDVVVTPAMIEAATAALISWYEGSTEFRDGARLSLEAGMSTRRELVHIEGGQL